MTLLEDQLISIGHSGLSEGINGLLRDARQKHQTKKLAKIENVNNAVAALAKMGYSIRDYRPVRNFLFGTGKLANQDIKFIKQVAESDITKLLQTYDALKISYDLKQSPDQDTIIKILRLSGTPHPVQAIKAYKKICTGSMPNGAREFHNLKRLGCTSIPDDLEYIAELLSSNGLVATQESVRRMPSKKLDYLHIFSRFELAKETLDTVAAEGYNLGDPKILDAAITLAMHKKYLNTFESKSKKIRKYIGNKNTIFNPLEVIGFENALIEPLKGKAYRFGSAEKVDLSDMSCSIVIIDGVKHYDFDMMVGANKKLYAEKIDGQYQVTTKPKKQKAQFNNLTEYEANIIKHRILTLNRACGKTTLKQVEDAAMSVIETNAGIYARKLTRFVFPGQ